MDATPRFVPSQTREPVPVPAWLRGSGEDGDAVDAAFRVGAALALLQSAAADDGDLGTLWRQRCALRAAAAHSGLAGRREDEAALRDSWYLRRADDEPGPAGRILGLWRRLGAASSLRSPAWEVALREGLDLAPASLGPLLDGVSAGNGQDQRLPVMGAARVAAAVLRAMPDAEGAALWLADVALARRLRWPAAVPLLVTHLRRADLRVARLAQGEEAWLRACCLAYARAALAALDLYGDLERRSARLLAARLRLRSKAAGRAVALLLREDAATAADAGQGTSERAGRRLFDRLVALGAVRELTGRPAFRLYGL